MPEDLPALFEMHRDPGANRMAGTKPRDREAYWKVWEKIFADPEVMARTILVEGEVGGGISRFRVGGVDALGYWVARAHWGRGVASEAVGLFLAECRTRPLHAHAAAANTASRRVLEKHGFRLTGTTQEPETERYVAGPVAAYVLDR